MVVALSPTHMYGTFMAKLSNCIQYLLGTPRTTPCFWQQRKESCMSQVSIQLVRVAQQVNRGLSINYGPVSCPMTAAGVLSVTDVAARKAISKDELQHCRRRTKGTEATISAIEGLLLSLESATDSLAVPFFTELMVDVWQDQKRHVKCLQVRC